MKNNIVTNSILIDTIDGIRRERPPVWFMRQAGRVLPRYLKLREKYSFKELMNDPQLATEVTLMPVDDLGVDAAILFSDILVIPEALGMRLEFTEKGPVFKNALKDIDLEKIDSIVPDKSSLEYIYRNIREIVKQKPADIPLIGFCGSPFTTLCYMIQGVSSNHIFPDAIRFIYQHQETTQKLVDLITDLSIEYACNQVENGVQVFQLFETHAGLIPTEVYINLILPAVKRISDAVRSTGTPFIFFLKGFGTGLSFIDHEICDFVSIDWHQSIFTARDFVGQKVGLQGNLDPRILTSDQEIIEQELNKYIGFGSKETKWIFNLGHGLTPDIPYENVKFVVDWIKNTNWKR